MNVQPPPFPASLDIVVPHELLDGLTTLEVGALYRLIRFAWRQDPPCTLPAEDSFLAAVARTTSEEWAAMKPQLLLALSAPPGACQDGRLVLQHALGVYRNLETAALRRRRNTTAATQAARLARGHPSDGPSLDRQRSVNGPSTDRQRSVDGPSHGAAPSVRSESKRPALQRSFPENSNPSAQSAQEDVIAVVGAGARALLADKLAAWRRMQCLRMLQEAIAAWRSEGATTYPIRDAAVLAESRHATPARVQALIEDAHARLAEARAKKRKSNPVGLVIHGLGESDKSRGRPSEIPIFLADRWSKIETETLRTLEAQAAISAKLARARSEIERAHG